MTFTASLTGVRAWLERLWSTNSPQEFIKDGAPPSFFFEKICLGIQSKVRRINFFEEKLLQFKKSKDLFLVAKK